MSETFTVREAASRLKVSKSFLDRLRVSGGHGPTFCRVGRGVRYREKDIEAWLERQSVRQAGQSS